jgi:hypothetical protein
MFIKIHKSYRTVIAICDSDLIGKTFEEGKRQLHVRENFYKDQEVDKEGLIEILKRQKMEDASFNIVGKESIQIALELGIIKSEGVHKIKSIPFALVLL